MEILKLIHKVHKLSFYLINVTLGLDFVRQYFMMEYRVTSLKFSEWALVWITFWKAKEKEPYNTTMELLFPLLSKLFLEQRTGLFMQKGNLKYNSIPLRFIFYKTWNLSTLFSELKTYILSHWDHLLWVDRNNKILYVWYYILKIRSIYSLGLLRIYIIQNNDRMTI